VGVAVFGGTEVAVLVAIAVGVRVEVGMSALVGVKVAVADAIAVGAFIEGGIEVGVS